MANIFNSVKGLHPRRNAFSADTYRNDFTAPLGVNIPVYLQEVPPATRIKLSTSALVRLQALIAPIMDNIDYYVHYWKIPYRLLENDRFTQFISGEIEAKDYDALFVSAEGLAQVVMQDLNNLSINYETKELYYNRIFQNGGIMDFLGYDVALFPEVEDDGEGDLTIHLHGNYTTTLNWRGLIAYYMLHTNWYMNENVPYFDDFVELVETLVKDQDIDALSSLLIGTVKFDVNYACSMLSHGWEKDYFTSALPNVQYGSPVTLPFSGNAPTAVTNQPVYFVGTDTTAINDLQPLLAKFDSAFTEDDNLVIEHIPGNPDLSQGNIVDDNNLQKLLYLQGRIFNLIDGELVPVQGTADLTEASAITINELRFANALQVFKERQMRYGRRRLEYYKGFFDVSPEDLRLQVPKYLGGGRIPINIADIEQTSKTDGTSALGHLAGKATAVAGGFAGFDTFCSEETIIIGIAFAMPHITYAQQVSRFKLKTNDIYDYLNPSFEHLGEQAVKNIEIFSGALKPDDDFGYQPRYTEYRFHSNEMHGAFKDTLAFWSLGRIFTTQPALNPQFIYMQPSVFNRIFAVSNQPPMIVSMIFHVKTIKPVSKYGTPMLLA